MSTLKTKFIQSTSALFVACHHQQPDADRAITYAEALWQKLNKRGYGSASKTESKSRVSTDYYVELDQNEQKWFCLFWTNFNNKAGRNNAAKRWKQLGKLSDADYQLICDAAKAEAAKALPQGQTRKMAEGWLSERRFEDTSPQPYAEKTKADPRREQIIEINGDLTHARRQFEITKDEGWKTEINRLEAKLKEAQG